MTQKNTSVNADLLTVPVAQTLKNMTIPMTYGMILLMTFNLVDTFFVGLLGTQPLAAISFTFPVTFTVISLAIGLGIGTSAVIAKTLGCGEPELARRQGTVALYVAGVTVCILSFIGWHFTDQIFSLLGASKQLLPLIHEYIDIWFLGSIGLIGPMIGNSILRANGDTKTPSLVMGSAGLVNALFDPILIFGLGPVPAMGLQGAAIATVISWIFALALIFYLLAFKRRLILLPLPKLAEFIIFTPQILRIGLPAASANMLTPLAAAVMTAIVAGFGESAVAGFGVGSRIESISMLVVLALSMTLPPFISQNFGAGNMHRVAQGYRSAIKFIMFWQLGIYLILLLAAPYIAAVFAKEAAVAEVIELFICILPLGYGLQGIVILTNSSFNALHQPLTALWLSIVRLFVCYVPIAYLGSLWWGLQGFFIGALCGNALMASLSYYLFKRQFRLQSKITTNEAGHEQRL
jgi:putative MATE family efflux protein